MPSGLRVVGLFAGIGGIELGLRAAGHAIVLTTHDLERAAPVATRLAILHRGRVAWTQEGAPEPVVVAAAYQAVVAGRA